MGVDLRIWPVVNGVYQDVLHLGVVKGVHRGGPRGAEGVLGRDQHHTDGWERAPRVDLGALSCVWVLRSLHAFHPGPTYPAMAGLTV